MLAGFYNILTKYIASLAGFGFIVLVLSGFALAHSSAARQSACQVSGDRYLAR
jgi:hypothetical protein